MNILSLQVGVPKKHEWNGRTIESSMVKTSVPLLQVAKTSIEGDRFSDPRHHGTPDSVFYAMSKDTYTEMNKRLGLQLKPGQLGENATMEMLDEQQIAVGDTFQVGGVVIEATCPRIPCEKLNYVTQNAKAQMAMVEIQKPGIYFRIIETGMIKSSDSFMPLKKSLSGLTIGELYKALTDMSMLKKCDNPKRLFEILENSFLLPKLKESMLKHATILKITKP